MEKLKDRSVENVPHDGRPAKENYVECHDARSQKTCIHLHSHTLPLDVRKEDTKALSAP
jgi:hypothetical protein